MTPLRVLLPLALLVAIALAEFPSPNQIKSYGKENDITLPQNPAIENEDLIGQPVVSDDADAKNKLKDDKKKSEDSNTPPKDTNDKSKEPENPKVPKDESKEPEVEPKDPKVENPKVPKDESKEPKAEPKDPKVENPKVPKDESKEPKVEPKDPKVENPKVPKDESKEPKVEPKDPKEENPKVPKDESKEPKVEPKDPKEENPKVPKDEPKDPKKEPKEPEYSYRLPEDIKPTHYTIDLKVDQDDLAKEVSKYEGTVSIEISVEKETNVIKLHYDKKTIQLVKIELIETETKESIEAHEKAETDLDKSICEINVKKPLAAKKTYILTLQFVGTVNSNSRGFYKGSYINEEGKKRWYAVTHFEPMGARSAFPCFDEPAFKAKFTISITHNAEYTVISNMPSANVADAGKSWKKTVFATTPEMSTYLVAFAITDFEKTDLKPEVYARKDVIEMGEFAATVGDQVLKELEEYTGIKFELPKMNQIALPLLQPGAMENWGLVTYRETAILYDEHVNATIDQQSVASIIAHEFAHQWFGNLVSPKWWKYIWLNEGFATYFQYYIADKINPNWRFMDQLNVACLQGKAFIHDADWTKTRPMDKEESKENEIGGMFDAVAYQKAGSVIRMFSHVLGEDTFKKGIRTYLKDNKGKAVTSEDLYKALDEVADKKTLPDGANVAKIFGDWATKKGYPLITVTKNAKTKSVTVKQEPFYVGEPGEETKDVVWYVPLNYVQENNEQDFEDTSVQEWLTDSSKTISKIGIDGWIIFNKQQTGYYRVNYDKENWAAISLYLKGENFTTIHPLNRAQLIDDALNLAYAGELEYDVALQLIAYLEQETDYIVWKSAFAAFTTLNKLLAATEHYTEFSKYLVTVTDSLMLNLSYTALPEESYLTKLLRVDAIKWSCESGSLFCKAYANEEVNKWLADHNENATLPRDLGKVLLCGAIRNYTFEEWNRVFVKYAASTNPEEKALILSALGCSSSPEILKYLLNLAIQPDSIFTGRVLNVLQTVYSNSAVGVQVTLDFILENIDRLLTYDLHFYDNLEKYVNELGSRIVLEDDAVKLRDIVGRKIIPEEKTQGALETVNRNVKWLKKNGKVIETWFGTYNTVTDPPPPTTTKGNGAGSLSLTTLLLAAPLLLARLR